VREDRQPAESRADARTGNNNGWDNIQGSASCAADRPLAPGGDTRLGPVLYCIGASARAARAHERHFDGSAIGTTQKASQTARTEAERAIVQRGHAPLFDRKLTLDENLQSGRAVRQPVIRRSELRFAPRGEQAPDVNGSVSIGLTPDAPDFVVGVRFPYTF
jgi:hypothetical protein